MKKNKKCDPIYNGDVSYVKYKKNYSVAFIDTLEVVYLDNGTNKIKYYDSGYDLKRWFIVYIIIKLKFTYEEI